MLNLVNKYKFIILFIFILFLFICSSNVFSISQTEVDTYTNFSDNVIDFSYYNDNGYSYCIGNSWSSYLHCYFVKSSNAVFAFYAYGGNTANIGAFDKDTHEQLPLYLALYSTSDGSLLDIGNTDINNTNNVRWNGYRSGQGNEGWFGPSGVPVIIKSNVNVYKNTSFNDTIYISSNNVSLFHLEYDKNLNSYVVCTKWVNVYEDASYRDMHNYYFMINPSKAPTSFDIGTCLDDGWISMLSNDIGPGREYDCTDEYYDNITTKEELMGINFRCRLQILDYGTYYFCCFNYKKYEEEESKKFSYTIVRFVFNEEGNSYTETLDQNTNTWTNKTNIDNNINNDLKNNINEQNSYDYFRVFYDECYVDALIYTNWFSRDNGYNYIVSYSNDNVHFSKDVFLEENDNGLNSFRYSFSVTENGTYYIRLKIYDSENSLVNTKTLQVKIRAIGVKDYRSEDTDVEYRLNNNTVYKFLKKNLGALFYPIDLLFDFFNRLDMIDEVQPTITVPTVREYFTNAIIINGFTYNLNSVLQNDTFAEVYNIYLNFVDFILFITVSYHLYKVLKEFLNFGGGLI